LHFFAQDSHGDRTTFARGKIVAHFSKKNRYFIMIKTKMRPLSPLFCYKKYSKISEKPEKRQKIGCKIDLLIQK
jgi:hypothetical protein